MGGPHRMTGSGHCGRPRQMDWPWCHASKERLLSEDTAGRARQRAAGLCLLSWGACDNPVVRCPVVVGRDEELAALAEIFSQAAGGRGVCAVVIGEAGIGKTRLVTEAADGARRRGQVAWVGRSAPVDRFSPLRPLR